jgi:hypothetical protein
VQCPAHDDRNPSLSITRIEGQALIHCFAGCDNREVVGALGLTMSDLYDDPKGATYPYEDGRIVHRTPDKHFKQSGNTKGTAQLYRASAVASAVRDGITVAVVEGEKDVHALESLGVVATTAPMGAANWSKVDPSPLHGGKIVVIPDADEAGQQWARSVLASLDGNVESLQFMAPKLGKDPADHVAAGYGRDDFSLIEPPVSQEPVATVDGAQVLNKIRDWLARFICPMADADLDLLTLWAAHTHVVNETYTTPRLQLDSPVHGSGKTTCLEHLQRLCVKPVQMASLSSPALLTRMLDAEMRTILIDEADRSLDPKKEGIADLLAVINSGYKRGGTRPVLVPGKGGQWVVKEMPTFAPVAMAGNNPNLPDDTRSRIIRVLLLPDLDGTVEESEWESIEPDAATLHDALAAWADQVRDDVRTTRPELPDGITGRFREKWAPLKRVATQAGGRWPEAVDQMALHDKAEYELDKEDGLVREAPSLVLLKHIHELWPGDTKFLPTSELISKLVINHPTMWGDEGPFGKRLTAQRLGRMLVQGYRIHSTRESAKGPRGYTHGSFTRPLSRMNIASKQTGTTGFSGLSGSVEPVEPVEPLMPVSPEGLTSGWRTCDACGHRFLSQGETICLPCEAMS